MIRSESPWVAKNIRLPVPHKFKLFKPFRFLELVSNVVRLSHVGELRCDLFGDDAIRVPHREPGKVTASAPRDLLSNLSTGPGVFGHECGQTGSTGLTVPATGPLSRRGAGYPPVEGKGAEVPSNNS